MVKAKSGGGGDPNQLINEHFPKTVDTKPRAPSKRPLEPQAALGEALSPRRPRPDEEPAANAKSSKKHIQRTILKRYEAEIEDANYKIEAICEHNLVIPEHVDITGEVDKQLERIAAAEDKLAAMRKYYGGKKADKTVL